MRAYLALAPFALLLFVLPFPGTVALRLLCLSIAFVIAVANWKRFASPALPLLLMIALALWALVAVASLAYAVDPTYSLGEIKNEIGYTMMAFAAFFAISRDERRVRWLWSALAAGGLLLSSAALVARFASGVWDDGWYGGVAAYASYLTMIVPVVMLLGFFTENGKMRYFALLLLIVLLVVGFYSGQRIIWPVLFLQACVALLLFRKTLRLDSVRLAALFGILAVSLATSLLTVQNARFKDSEYAANAQISRDERLIFWPKVLERILERPLTGAGFGRGVMNKAYRDLIPENNRELWHAHNIVLNSGLSMGIPGMLALMLIFGALSLQYRRFLLVPDRRLRLLGACGIALVLGVFARNMVNDLFLRDGALLFWAINGSFLGLGLRLMAAQPKLAEGAAHA